MWSGARAIVRDFAVNALERVDLRGACCEGNATVQRSVDEHGSAPLDTPRGASRGVAPGHDWPSLMLLGQPCEASQQHTLLSSATAARSCNSSDAIARSASARVAMRAIAVSSLRSSASVSLHIQSERRPEATHSVG